MADGEGRGADDATLRGEQARARLVDHVEVVCEAVLGRGAITIGELDRLAPGETLALDASPADPAEVFVNGKLIARGEVVTIDGRFAIRITEIG